MQIHVVIPGDTLATISQRYGTTSNILMQINLLSSANIVSGQTLLIPVNTQPYVVMPGDTLYEIAQLFELSQSTIRMQNPQIEGRSLIVGEILKLPKGTLPQKIGLGFLELIDTKTDRINVLSYGPYSTFLALFTYGMNADGQIIPAMDQSALETIPQTGTRPVASFSNWTSVGFSADAVHAVLETPMTRQQYIAQVLEILSQKGYRAVVIDFESLLPEDGKLFVSFLEELNTQLQPLKIPLIVAIMPITGFSSLEKPVIQAYPYAEIAEHTTFVMLMSYNWSWPGGPPGPIAPFTKVDENIRYALARIPSNKILLGIVQYGYDWVIPYVIGSTTGTLGVEDVVEIAMRKQIPIQFDTDSLSPWLRYQRSSGKEHLIWFEDARSLQLKLQLVRKYQLAGTAAWQFGQRFPQYIPLLFDNFSIYKY